MKKINENQKVTLTIGQLRRLVRETIEDEKMVRLQSASVGNKFALIDINGTSDSKFLYRNKPCELITTGDAKEELERECGRSVYNRKFYRIVPAKLVKHI